MYFEERRHNQDVDKNVFFAVASLIHAVFFDKCPNGDLFLQCSQVKVRKTIYMYAM